MKYIMSGDSQVWRKGNFAINKKKKEKNDLSGKLRNAHFGAFWSLAYFL